MTKTFYNLIHEELDVNPIEYLSELFFQETIYNILNYVDMRKIFPNAEFIAKYTNNNIGYHARECDIEIISIYKLNDEYIIYNPNYGSHGEESDLHIFDIEYHYGEDCNIEDFFKHTITICSNIDCDEIINKNSINDITFIVDIFKNVHKEKGNEMFLDYMKTYYQTL